MNDVIYLARHAHHYLAMFRYKLKSLYSTTSSDSPSRHSELLFIHQELQLHSVTP